MSKPIVMPQEDWLAALNSARALAHTSGAIKSGELASILDSITAIGAQFKAIANGTITIVSEPSGWTGLEIQHGMGVVPSFFVLMADEIASSADQYELNFAIGAHMPGGTTGAKVGVWGIGRINNGVRSVTTFELEATSPSNGYNVPQLFNAQSVNVLGMYFRQGRKFHWICGAMNNY